VSRAGAEWRGIRWDNLFHSSHIILIAETLLLLPHFDNAVIAGTNQSLTIWANSDRIDCTCIPLQGVPQFPSSQIPEVNSSFSTATNQGVTIQANSDRIGIA
jgi:hypothetical protein